MEKKSVAATLTVIYAALIFAVIGACFSAFIYKNTKIEIKNVSIVSSSSIEIFSDEKLTKKVNALELSDMELGLKPATGKLDSESQIPSTITDEGTSEGYFASVYVKTNVDYKIIVKDIAIETKHDKIAANEERKNIFVSIKDVKNTTKSLEKDNFELVKFENNTQTQKLTFLIWLGSLSGEELEGAKISFTLEFVQI